MTVLPATVAHVRPIPGLDGYLADRLGRVWSERRGPRRLLSGHSRPKGYIFTNVQKDGSNWCVGVHVLVCSAFYGPPAPGQEVRHLDGNPSNNQPENLQWGSHAQNMQDRIEHGRNHLSARTHCPQGHAYDDENTMLVRQGRPASVERSWRVCRACRAMRDKGRVRSRG